MFISDLNKLIDDKDIKSFMTMFSTTEDIKTFRDENDNNLLHILAGKAEPDFMMECYDYMVRVDKDTVNLLLTSRNNRGRLPANKDYASQEEKQAVINALNGHNSDKIQINHRSNSFYKHNSETLEEKRRNAIYHFLKRETKAVINTAEYKEKQVVASSVEAKSRTDAIAFYPNICLFHEVKNNGQDYERSEGLNTSDKNDTSFINHNELRKSNSKSEDVRITGEQVIVSGIRISDRPLAKEVEERLDFPEDFVDTIFMLNDVGESVKTLLKKPETEHLIRKFTTDDGTITLFDTKKTSTYGSFNARNNVISIFTRAKYKDVVDSTLFHELTHANDTCREITINNDKIKEKNIRFSDNPAFLTYLALEAYNKDEEATQIFKGIIKGYKISSFEEEALAYLNTDINEKSKKNDPLKKDIFTVFRIYSKALTAHNTELVEFIDKTMKEGMSFRCELFNTMIDGLIKDKKISDIYTEQEKKEISEHYMPAFKRDMFLILKRIRNEERKYRTEKSIAYESQYHRNLDFLPDAQTITAIYNDTSETAKELDKNGINNLIKQALSDYEEKGGGQLQLFRIGILLTEMKKKYYNYSDDNGKAYTSPDDFYEISSPYFDKSRLIMQAKKITKIAENTNNGISDEAIKIAISTTANVVKVQQILDEEKTKANNATAVMAEDNFIKIYQDISNKEKTKVSSVNTTTSEDNSVTVVPDKVNVYDIIRLVKSAEYAAKIRGNNDYFAPEHPTDYDPSLASNEEPSFKMLILNQTKRLKRRIQADRMNHKNHFALASVSSVNNR